MGHAVIISLSLIGLMAPVGAAQAGLLPDRVEKAARERVAGGLYPTLVIGMVDGEKDEIAAFGTLPDGRAADSDTVFEIGSVTKTFTATLLADAVRTGEVHLDEPVAALLPGFRIPERNGKAITLLDIATQYSGLPWMPSNFEPADPLNPYADYDAARLEAFLAGYELPRDPGTSYEYSNLAVGMLGYALAEKAKTNYRDLLAQKILHPLGMTMSGTAFTDEMKMHLAPGFDGQGKPALNWDMDVLAGAGAIRSTVADMLRYLRANMGLESTGLTPAMKLAQASRRDFGEGGHIGLAWMTRPDPQGDIVWHNGMTGGYASFVGLSADGRHGIVILTNKAANVDELGFAALLPDAHLSPVPKAVAMTGEQLDDYVGNYKLRDNFLIRVNRAGDQLAAQATGQGAFPIFPSGTNEFFARVADVSISFTRDEKGAVDGLVLHQLGDHAAPELSAAELPAEPKAVRLDAVILRDYIGKFALAPDAVLEVTLADAQLSAQLTGQPAFPIYASDKDKFFYKIVEAQIDFERDANGKVSSLTLHQAGRDLPASRLSP
ncbi:MAG TPA: serine hydrolase [Aliidongia sp.]|nr:serine hydrolase [Aliidongia sp.]